MAATAILITEAEATSVVKSVLAGVYGQPRDGFDTLINFVSVRIAKILTKEGKTAVETERLHRDVLTSIWNNYAGGDTAEAATNRIFAALDIAV